MEFRALRLAGFKSFVERCELRIEPGLTGVVGPNGCGKSNLLEALRWVMGEGSPKSLRSGGMDDVIFAGTGTRPAHSLAQVTLALAGAAGEDLEVSRRIERGAGSDYRINGREARAQDVRLLFADSATGAHSPAIVGQGQISAIIAAKPAERRLLLEEAAGIAGLHVRRREAEIRLRAAQANLERIDDVVRGLEAQASALRRQARVAARYRDLSDRLKIAEASLIFARWSAAQAGAAMSTDVATAAEAATTDRARIAAALAASAANAAAGLPALRLAEAKAGAAEQVLHQSRALYEAEAMSAARRHAAIAALLETAKRDAAREVALADDATAAVTRLTAQAEVLAAALAAHEETLPVEQARAVQADAAALDAEATLVAAVDGHAAAAAQARAAVAGRETAAARLGRAEAEGRDLAARRARRPPPPDTAGLADAVTAAVAAQAAAQSVLADAEAARPPFEATRTTAAATQAAARATLAGLAAEAEALARRLAADAPKTPRIADRIAAQAGYEAALAAALGDDLDAGPADCDAPRRWTGATAADDPPLPIGATALAQFVHAPPELARRLAAVGVVDADAAPASRATAGYAERVAVALGRLCRRGGARRCRSGAAAGAAACCRSCS